MKKFALLLLAFIITYSVNAQTADEIIEKSIKAYGGVEAMNKINNVYMESVMKVPMAGMEMPMNTWTKITDNVTKVKVKMEAMGQKMEYGFDGQNYWMSMGGMVQDVPANMQDQIKSQLNQSSGNSRHPLFDYKKNGMTATFEGKEDVDGKPCLKVKVTKGKTEPTTYFFDAISYFIIRMDATTSVQGQTMDISTYLRENQKVNGVIMPKRIEVMMQGQVQAELSINKIDVNTPISDSEFTKPSK